MRSTIILDAFNYLPLNARVCNFFLSGEIFFNKIPAAQQQSRIYFTKKIQQERIFTVQKDNNLAEC